jgi:hypothetical protein
LRKFLNNVHTRRQMINRIAFDIILCLIKTEEIRFKNTFSADPPNLNIQYPTHKGHQTSVSIFFFLR